MSKRPGVLRFHLMQNWVREGVPDYVAMPQESARILYTRIGEKDADLPMMKAHGVYAPYRLLVTYFIEDAGWSIEKLMTTRLSLEQARAIVFKALQS